jgi:hypothetical protein
VSSPRTTTVTAAAAKYATAWKELTLPPMMMRPTAEVGSTAKPASR